ncbi:hypothetical protein [Hufsiella arboris]|nr:hypothetical protein [Hufsiella arboris]
MPNVPNTPMLDSKGELSAAAHISLKGNVSLNSAYAASDHFAVLLNGSIMNNKHSDEDFRHNLIEAGAGYFNNFGDDKERIFEIYAGLGKGNSERNYREETGDHIYTTTERQEFTLNKYFAQVNYSAKKKDGIKLFNKNIELNYGTVFRLSYINMKDFKLNDVYQPTEDNIFIEPVFFTRTALSKNVQLQYTTSSNFGLKNRKYLTAGNSIFTIGLIVNVGGKK